MGLCKDPLQLLKGRVDNQSETHIYLHMVVIVGGGGGSKGNGVIKLDIRLAWW